MRPSLRRASTSIIHLLAPVLIGMMPAVATAQALAAGSIGVVAEVLPAPAVASAVASPMRFASLSSSGRWESHVRISLPERQVLEVDGRRLDDRDMGHLVDLVARADGSVERRYTTRAMGEGGAASGDRELTVRFAPRPDSALVSAVVRITILVGYDGGT